MAVDPRGDPPAQEQPYYHLLAENAETEYIAYVSEQNLLADETGKPLRHPQVTELFTEDENGGYSALYPAGALTAGIQRRQRARPELKCKDRPALIASGLSFRLCAASYFFADGAGPGQRERSLPAAAAAGFFISSAL